MTDFQDAMSESVSATQPAEPWWTDIMKASQEMRRSQFNELGTPARSVVFLGDSITEGGLWSEWFPGLSILNRGIGGDTIEGVAARLETAINDPLAISLLIGTNDLGGGFPGMEQPLADPLDLAQAFERLVSAVRTLAPQAPLIINSIMPRAELFAPTIGVVNDEYRRIAAKAGAHFVDLWPSLADGQAIRAEYSLDELHLTGPGYRAWVSCLSPILEAVIDKG
jgi:lysophospholipase L1-like esterase